MPDDLAEAVRLLRLIAAYTIPPARKKVYRKTQKATNYGPANWQNGQDGKPVPWHVALPLYTRSVIMRNLSTAGGAAGNVYFWDGDGDTPENDTDWQTLGAGLAISWEAQMGSRGFPRSLTVKPDTTATDVQVEIEVWAGASPQEV